MRKDQIKRIREILNFIEAVSDDDHKDTCFEVGKFYKFEDRYFRVLSITPSGLIGYLGVDQYMDFGEFVIGSEVYRNSEEISKEECINALKEKTEKIINRKSVQEIIQEQQ